LGGVFPASEQRLSKYSVKVNDCVDFRVFTRSEFSLLWLSCCNQSHVNLTEVRLHHAVAKRPIAH